MVLLARGLFPPTLELDHTLTNIHLGGRRRRCSPEQFALIKSFTANNGDTDIEQLAIENRTLRLV